MSNINALLNHEPRAGRQPQETSQDQSQPTTFEAADALTTLATLGSGEQYARELPSPTATVLAAAPRPASGYSAPVAPVAPVEPLPPVDEPLLHSPSLQAYHHEPPSPEEQKRRQSLLATASPTPVLAPIRHPLDDPHGQISDDPPTSKMHEPEPFVKDETADMLREGTPSAAAHAPDRRNSVTAENMDVETLKAIEIAKQSDLGLRVKRTASITDSITSPTEPKPAPALSKKRPAPSSASLVKKKGTATAKKPSKKRKLDTDAESNPRSQTPTPRTAKLPPGKGAKKGSQAGTPVAESSPAPDNSSQAVPSDDEAAESSDDSTLYCICKKPDNHRWMIGCDGGCDDWFHGDCVKMSPADEDLLDKFICPLCEKAGRGQTTWKPMCRRMPCRKPARLARGKESKYCSDECGVHFMAEQLQRTAGAKDGNSSKKKSKKKGFKGHDDADHVTDDDDEPTPLGGVLRAKDLKALVEASPSIEAFKGLGSGVLSPPHTASPTKPTFDGPLPNGTPAYNPVEDVSLTPSEREHLGALHKEKSDLKDRLELLKDREKFVSMVKEQATRFAEREKIKTKEFCGYDSRLSWSDAEFLAWRNSKYGRAAFRFSTLSPTAEHIASTMSVNDEAAVPNGDEQHKETVCLKKRCPKHPQWQKLNLQDARFEELEVVEAIKECEKEERSVRERARRRSAKDVMERELTGGEPGKAERNREGWVEAVPS